nr:hypothetical transcript [Hymenolepis microstoma]
MEQKLVIPDKLDIRNLGPLSLEFSSDLGLHCVERYWPVYSLQNYGPLLVKCLMRFSWISAVLGGSLLPIDCIADCESEELPRCAILMAPISPSNADLLCPAAVHSKPLHRRLRGFLRVTR